MNYVGAAQKLTEAQLVLQPIQMGARVYLPGLGRFLQVDPVQGGTPNPYTYVTDPVNDFDLSGLASRKRKKGSLFANVMFWAKPPIVPRFGGTGKGNSVPKSSASPRTPRTIRAGSPEAKEAKLQHIKPDRVTQLQKEGKIDPHGKGTKIGGSRTDLFYDKHGNVYEALKAKEGAGKKIYEPTGDNIYNSPKSGDYTYLLIPYGEPA